MKFKLEHSNWNLNSYQGLIASQAEIKTLISQIRLTAAWSRPPSSSSSAKVLRTLHQLTTVSSTTASTISELMSLRLKATTFGSPLFDQTNGWTIELLVPWTSLPASPPNLQRGLNSFKKKLDPGYLLILRTVRPEAPQDRLIVPEAEVDPFGEARGSVSRSLVDSSLEDEMGRVNIRVSRRGNVIVAENSEEALPLNQHGAKTAVNDFLATFSILYEDLPEEDETKGLVEEEGI